MMQGGPQPNNNKDNTRASTEKVPEEQKTQLLDHLDWSTAGHNVTVSNTMIKVTYNKGMKDHAVKPMSGNDFERKKHSLTYKSSSSDECSPKVPASDKNSKKKISNIVFISDTKVNKNNEPKITKNITSKKQSDVKTEEKTHIKSNKNSSSQGIAKKMSTGNSSKNVEDHHLKQPKVAASKANIAESQSTSGPSASGSKAHEDSNISASELGVKKLTENDGSKSQNDYKDVVSTGTLKIKIKKDKIKPNVSDHKEKGKGKERLKSLKNENSSSKKKSATEKTAQVKKPKSESDTSGKQAKEKGNTPKGKVKEKKVVPNEKGKKIPTKIIDDANDFKDNSKKELLREDPTLPPGWRRIIKGKHVGSELRPVVCIASPEGRKFYFKARLKEYLEKNNSHLTVNDFYFGLYDKSDKDKEESKSSVSEGKKITPKKSNKKKRSDSDVLENNSKKICLDNSSNLEEAQEQFLDLNSGAPSSGDKDDTGNKNLLLVDPELPAGWVRKVKVKNDEEGQNNIQVWIISPEGKKFRRKYLLQKYLVKTGSPLDINQFYFGLYPRRDGAGNSPIPDQSQESTKSQSKTKNATKKAQKGEGSKSHVKEGEGQSESTKKKSMSMILTKLDGSINIGGEEPMLEDPSLPPGWNRYIKVRSTGESAGRMEVIITSPDGKRHRSKGTLENYIKQKGLDLNVDDFDFSVFGKNSKKFSTAPAASSTPKRKSDGTSTKKKSCTSSQSDPKNSSVNSVEETTTPEASMINYVSALMLNCGLRDLRSERRLRTPKQEQEKILKNYIESEATDAESDKNEIPSSWVQKLVHCRSDFGTVEPDAAETIASLTKDFLVGLTKNALKLSKDENNLEYNDLAELVDKTESLSPLKTLIPKKITFKEFLKLNRPKKFTSFT